jgi:hypothetical protein
MSRADHPRVGHRLRLVALLAAGASVVLLFITPRAIASPPVPREPVRSQAAVSFDIMADLYRLRLDGAAGQCAVRCQTVRTQLAEQLRTLFDSRYRFVVWSRGTAAPPRDTVLLRLRQVALGKPLELELRLADSARARMYGVVPVSIAFEQYHAAAIRPAGEWAPDRLLRAWADTVARRLDATSDVVPNVVGRLPLTAQVTLAPDQLNTTVFVSPDSLRVSPGEKVAFTIRLSISERVLSETLNGIGELQLEGCEVSTARNYVCRKRAFRWRDSTGSPAYLAEVNRRASSVQVRSVHLRQIERGSDAMLAGGIAPLPKGTP